MISRAEATEQILAAKCEKKLTFEAIAKAVGRHKVWVTAALHGQATMSAEEATKASKLLGLGPQAALALQQIPPTASLDDELPRTPLLHPFRPTTLPPAN